MLGAWLNVGSRFRWAAAAGCGALVITWAVSGWGFFGVRSAAANVATVVGFSHGQFVLQRLYFPMQGPAGWRLWSQWSGTGCQWSWWFDRVNGLHVAAWYVPLWIVAVPFVGAAGVLWRGSAARDRFGLCGACGYNRAGLTEGSACPECGRAATHPMASSVGH